MATKRPPTRSPNRAKTNLIAPKAAKSRIIANKTALTASGRSGGLRGATGPAIQSQALRDRLATLRMLERTDDLGPPRAMGYSRGTGYDGAAQGRRMHNWQPPRQGPNTVLWNSLDQLVARSRDAVRNNPWATSCIDNAESQLVSTGIRPIWNVKNKKLKEQIETKFAHWAKASGFYQTQALLCREIYEGGECFARFISKAPTPRQKVGLKIQLIETEQLPIFLNMPPGNGSARTMPSSNNQTLPAGNYVRVGIEFDKTDEVSAYWFYQGHPGDASFNPAGTFQYQRVDEADVLHVFRRIRAGQLRGQPALTAVLALIHELDEYADAELARKKIQRMFAAFIEKVSPEGDIMPTDQPGSSPQTPQTLQGNSPYTDQVTNALLESGTINELLPGESIKFPNLPPDMDFASFMAVEGHRFAAAVGCTYEQLTGDLKGVTYSSIRAGIIDFRRRAEMFQANVLVHQFCQPAAVRWLEEAQMAGEIILPGYAASPEKYTNIQWANRGWDWVDPLKDATAELTLIEAGLQSRTRSVASTGRDIIDLDNEIADERQRAKTLKLIFTSDAANNVKSASGPGRPGATDKPPDSADGGDGTTENQDASGAGDNAGAGGGSD